MKYFENVILQNIDLLLPYIWTRGYIKELCFYVLNILKNCLDRVCRRKWCKYDKMFWAMRQNFSRNKIIKHIKIFEKSIVPSKYWLHWRINLFCYSLEFIVYFRDDITFNTFLAVRVSETVPNWCLHPLAQNE